MKSLSLTADFVFIRVRQRLTKTVFRTLIIFVVIKAFVSLCYYDKWMRGFFQMSIFAASLVLRVVWAIRKKPRLTNSKADRWSQLKEFHISPRLLEPGINMHVGWAGLIWWCCNCISEESVFLEARGHNFVAIVQYVYYCYCQPHRTQAWESSSLP